MSDLSYIKAIVIGGLNTDIVALGVSHFPKPGGYALGQELKIGPGGKSRNIADMLANLLPPHQVAMVGRTVRDSYGLWKPPVEALRKSSVNTDFIRIMEAHETDKMPGLAFIPVNHEGQNQIFLVPGVRDEFNIEDIDKAETLFQAAAQNDGFLVLTMECPPTTSAYAMKKSQAFGMRVLCDPGGVESDTEFREILQARPFLIKPNEHEAEILTGVSVKDMQSAETAARKLQDAGIENVMITAGVAGAYVFTPDKKVHIPIPSVKAGTERDETGCGDQTMAAIAAGLIAGEGLIEAAHEAVLAGTLQFHKSGIQPITHQDLQQAQANHNPV